MWVIRLTSAKARGAIRVITEMSFVSEFYLLEIKGQRRRCYGSMRYRAEVMNSHCEGWKLNSGNYPLYLHCGATLLPSELPKITKLSPFVY